MRTAVINGYGDTSVFEIKEMPEPTCQGHEVLVKVAAAGVNAIDWKIRQGKLRYLVPITFPAILGFDICGEVVATGSHATSFKIGDWVIARSHYAEGRGYAEYIALDQKYVAAKPAHMTAVEAASLPLASMTALQGLRDYGHIAPGMEVMIIGASGGVGTFAVQLAKILGASVTAVCSVSNVELVHSLGAAYIVDYMESGGLFDKEDRYDLIFDTVTKTIYDDVKENLTPRGTYVATLPSLRTTMGLLMNTFTARQCSFMVSKNRAEDLRYIVQLVEEGKLKAVIDSVFPLEDVAKAHLRSETERARGKIVLDFTATSNHA